MHTRTPAGITFPLHEVKPAAEALATTKTKDAIQRLLGTNVEACCDYTTDCVKKVAFHPLLATAHIAYAEHRPLILSPDMIWVTIVQGLAQHVKNHAEGLRSLFVGHQGKLEITIQHHDIHKGSPENAWAHVVHDFSAAIRLHIGHRYDQLVSDFTTTGPLERTACEVALLDTFQPYFEFRLVAGCGIPEITLEGTTEDWQRLREKVEYLTPYGLDWWLPSLRAICDHFVRASTGDVDCKHWRDICKQEKDYGADIINGWLSKLIPYLKNHRTGNFTVRNELLRDPDAKLSTDSLPTGICQVPFRCRWQGRSEDAAMEFLGGFLGVTQDKETLALRPKMGWAVREGSELDQLFVRLGKFEPASPLAPDEFDRQIERLNGRWGELPGDFALFYKKFNGVTTSVCTVLPLELVEKVEDKKRQGEEVYVMTGPWAKFGELPDGSSVALELSKKEQGWRVVRVEPGVSPTDCPVVASSFAEFLQAVL